jgi:hypothetical protein
MFFSLDQLIGSADRSRAGLPRMSHSDEPLVSVPSVGVSVIGKKVLPHLREEATEPRYRYERSTPSSLSRASAAWSFDDPSLGSPNLSQGYDRHHLRPRFYNIQSYENSLERSTRIRSHGWLPWVSIILLTIQMLWPSPMYKACIAPRHS